MNLKDSNVIATFLKEYFLDWTCRGLWVSFLLFYQLMSLTITFFSKFNAEQKLPLISNLKNNFMIILYGQYDKRLLSSLMFSFTISRIKNEQLPQKSSPRYLNQACKKNFRSQQLDV